MKDAERNLLYKYCSRTVDNIGTHHIITVICCVVHIVQVVFFDRTARSGPNPTLMIRDLGLLESGKWDSYLLINDADLWGSAGSQGRSRSFLGSGPLILYTNFQNYTFLSHIPRYFTMVLACQGLALLRDLIIERILIFTMIQFFLGIRISI